MVENNSPVGVRWLLSSLPYSISASTRVHRTLVVHTVLEHMTFSSLAVGFKVSPMVRKAETDCCATSYGICWPTTWNLVTGPSKYQDYEILVTSDSQKMTYSYFEEDRPALHLIQWFAAIPGGWQGTGKLRHYWKWVVVDLVLGLGSDVDATIVFYRRYVRTFILQCGVSSCSSKLDKFR